MRGDLANSIRYEVGPDFVEIIAGPTVYAAIHQYGVRTGRGRTTKMPTRPFLSLFIDAPSEIVDATMPWVGRSKAAELIETAIPSVWLCGTFLALERGYGGRVKRLVKFLIEFRRV